MDLDFTGEYFIPGKASGRLAADHLERYRFAAHYAVGKRVLDIACGVGYGTQLMAEAGAAQVDGIDISEKVIAHARAHYPAANASFAVGNICYVAASAPYDLAVCFETIEHVPDYQAALENLYRLIGPGGMLIVSTPNRTVTSPLISSLHDTPANQFHIREFTLKEFSGALNGAGFEVNPNEIFGQRYRRAVGGRTLQGLYNRLWKPDQRSSPQVSRKANEIPRYYVVIARRPAF